MQQISRYLKKTDFEAASDPKSQKLRHWREAHPIIGKRWSWTVPMYVTWYIAKVLNAKYGFKTDHFENWT